MIFTHTFQDNTLTYSDVLGVSRLMFLSNSGPLSTMFLMPWMFLLGTRRRRDVPVTCHKRSASHLKAWCLSRCSCSGTFWHSFFKNTLPYHIEPTMNISHSSVLDNDPLDSHDPRGMFLKSPSLQGRSLVSKYLPYWSARWNITLPNRIVYLCNCLEMFCQSDSTERPKKLSQSPLFQG